MLLEPGESLTLEPFIAHSFWAEGGAVLAGEISLANDDATDNYFLPPLEPSAAIEEDTPMRYVTLRDHAKFSLARRSGFTRRRYQFAKLSCSA